MVSIGRGFCVRRRSNALLGFPWKEFPQDSVIIDVGGGTGHVSMVLYQHFPHLKLVVQDRHQTIDHAKEVSPAALRSRVR